MIVDVSSLNILIWLKNPNNIFAGTIELNNELLYSNIFSGFITTPLKLIESLTFTNIDTLKDKNIGYITPDQHKFADLLDSIRSRCYNISSQYIDSFPITLLDFQSTISRIWKARFIKKILEPYTDLAIGNQCIVKTPAVRILSTLGVGGFGVVYEASSLDNSYKFAIKMTVDNINKTAVSHPYSHEEKGWDEINILRPYICSLIEKGICPNFCYTYDSFICNSCDFEGLKKKKGFPCLNIVMELATGGTLEKWQQDKHSEQEQYGAIFQCMAGIHTAQKYYQLSNEDIKDANILVSTCKPGGYWEYVVMGKSYYIPNSGEVFLINDYGIGKSYDLTIDICARIDKFAEKKSGKRLGIKYADYRPFIVVDGKFELIKYSAKRGKRIGDNSFPLICQVKGENYTKGIRGVISDDQPDDYEKYDCQLSSVQLKTLEKNGVPTNPTNPLFFSNSNIVPYIQMFSDTQDTIRMFIGDIERSNLKTSHNETPNMSPKIKTRLEEFMLEKIPGGIFARLQEWQTIKPSHVLAGYFIQDFFQDIFQEKPNGPLIQRYVI